MSWKNTNVLITGGLGFLGSNLAIKLVSLGSNVAIVDDYSSGNSFNLDPIADKVILYNKSVTDVAFMTDVLKESNLVFHLAAKVDHLSWRTDPLPYIKNNVEGTLCVLEAWKASKNKPKVIGAGTRGEYGKQNTLPVSENSPTEPLGLYELTKLQSYHLMQLYAKTFGMKYCHARISNVYGPRAQMTSCNSGVINWFIHLAMEDADIPLFDGGKVKRDFLYVDDCINALIALAETPEAIGLFNVGNSASMSLLNAVEGILETCHSGKIKFTEYTSERKLQEPGDFTPSIEKICAETGWKPTTSFKTGIKETVEYYRKNRFKYW